MVVGNLASAAPMFFGNEGLCVFIGKIAFKQHVLKVEIEN